MFSPDSTFVNVVDLRMPGLHVRNFALHRPAADQAVIEAHPRHWSKAVFFLDGSGALPVADQDQPEAGTVIMLPPGDGRRCAPTARRLPLCMVFDFRLADGRQRTASVCTVQRAELLRAREQLAYLLRLQAEGGGQAACESAVIVLNLLVTLLRTAGWLGRIATAPHGAGDSAMHRLLLTMPLESPLQQVVERSGYQRDHLNRLIKKETGLTLGQFRMQRRLNKAKELLAHGLKVGDVAGEIGLPDQSYFARWFRRQTGLPPSHWLQAGAEQSPLDLVLCG